MSDNCSSCGKKIKKEFNFCPYCGFSFKKHKEQENFGLLGRDDADDMPASFPLRNLDKLMAPLVKQIFEQFDKQGSGSKSPRGLKIQISAGKPQIQKTATPKINISEKELERRKTLPRKDAESNVRRLSDKIVYEICAPGIKSKEDISVTKLESGFEIKAYSKDFCFVKTIPFNSDLLNISIKDGTLFIELKN